MISWIYSNVTNPAENGAKAPATPSTKDTTSQPPTTDTAVKGTASKRKAEAGDDDDVDPELAEYVHL